MTQIETLADTRGRILVRKIYRELRYERRLGTFQTLSVLWRICCREQELIRSTRQDVVVLHPLGIWQGTALWMEEVVNRFYFSPINAWVYAGAALLLVAVGLNRVGVFDSPGIVVAGVVLEALLLLVLFSVMYFTPPEESEAADDTSAGTQNEATELLREIGEIGRDYAAMAVQLEAISNALVEIVERQGQLVESVSTSVMKAVEAVAPNPQLMQSMEHTSKGLEEFAASLAGINDKLRAIQMHEVQVTVRAELERILSATIMDSRQSTTKG